MVITKTLKKDCNYWTRHNSNDYVVMYYEMLNVESEFELFSDSPVNLYNEEIYVAKTLYFVTMDALKDYIKHTSTKGMIFYCIVHFPLNHSSPIGSKVIKHHYGLRYLELQK